jgi:DNA-binding SARP family transcriptional activator/ABC-type transport system substrate-binding protein/streptogramin lyase
MEFRLLGPLEVRKDDRVLPVGGAKQRALLAIFLLHANELVSRDRLIDELWGERPPGTADHSLDHQVSRLRKTLGLAELLVTRWGGYVLQIDPEQIDVRRFERLLEQGRSGNAAGKPAEAAEALREALALWRGGALADLAYEPFARGEIDRLEELRLAAIEERIEAELALGRHQALVAELESLAPKHPLRERLRAQLMLALYRSGRQAEALRVYTDTRRKLVEELGIEPGQTLGELEQAILRHDTSLDLPSAAETERRPHRRRRAILTALALALAGGAAAAGVLLAGGGTQSSRAQSLAQPDSVTLVSTSSGKPIESTQLQAPRLSRFGEGALWNLSSKGILTKVNSATGKVIASVNAVPVPCGLAVGEGSVWVSDCGSPTLVRVDPGQTVVVDRFPLPPTAEPQIATQTGEVAVGAGSVWVGQGFTNPSYVWRLDPRTGHLLKRYLIPEGGAEALAFGDGALWVGGGAIGRLSRIDPRTNEVTTPVRDFGGWLCCVSVGGGYVWAAVNPAGKVWKASEGGQVVDGITLAANIEDLTYADGAVWASAGEAGTVVRIDPTTDATRSYRLGHHVIGVAVRNGVLAVSVQPAGQALTADLKGRIVYVALKEDDLDSNTSTDPLGIQSFNAAQIQFHYATCAKLFNYPDASGAPGERLVPEVAAGWPKVTDGGRTYTFRIRPGYGFSPPSHEAVTAESFRHEIERVLSPNGSGPSGLLSDVVGAKAYTDGKSAHVSGVSAHGDTLVIRLLRPAGDLPTRLALPSFCAVPINLPTVPYGLPYPIPTAGPYYLAGRSSDVFVLKPNPNYHGPRARRLDAIVYRTGTDTGRAAVQVAQDTTDYLQEADPALAPETVAARGAGPRYRLTANNWTERLALNTSRPLFVDIRLRRAVQYALDRTTLAHALDNGAFQLPTNHLLPPNLRDSDAGSGYPTSSDLPAARRLMAGRHLHAVFAAYAPATGNVSDPEFVRALRKQLAAIGITLTVVPIRQNYSPAQYAAVLAQADITHTNRNAGNATDPIEYLLHLPYLPAADRAKLDRIAAFPIPRREMAAESVATQLERDAVYIGFSDGATPELVSKRLGCIIDQPEYPGLDLAALCLRTS